MRLVQSGPDNLFFGMMLPPHLMQPASGPWIRELPVYDRWYLPGECDAGRKPSVPVHLVKGEICYHRLQFQEKFRGLDMRDPDNIKMVRAASILTKEMLIVDGALAEIEGVPVIGGIAGGTLLSSSLQPLPVDEARFYRRPEDMVPPHIRYRHTDETPAFEYEGKLVHPVRAEFTEIGQRLGQGIWSNILVRREWTGIVAIDDLDNKAAKDIRAPKISQCGPFPPEGFSHFPALHQLAA